MTYEFGRKKSAQVVEMDGIGEALIFVLVSLWLVGR
jgi:hypothetical protein